MDNEVCINPECEAYGDMGAYVPGVSGYTALEDVPEDHCNCCGEKLGTVSQWADSFKAGRR